MIIRTDKMRASKAMQHRVMNTPNIKIHWNTNIQFFKNKLKNGNTLYLIFRF